MFEYRKEKRTTKRYGKTDDEDPSVFLGDGDENDYPLKPCVKCRNDHGTVRYHSDGSKCGAFETVFTGEHLHITCSRCGYQWPQLPDDAK